VPNPQQPSSPPKKDFSTITTTIKTLKDNQIPLSIAFGIESAPLTHELSTGSGNFEGFEVALFDEIIRRWQASLSLKVDKIKVDISTRHSSLNDKTADIVAAAIPQNDNNCYLSTTICNRIPYAIDELAILTSISTTTTSSRPAISSTIQSQICLLLKQPNTVIAALKGTEGAKEAERVLTECKELFTNKDRIKDYPNRQRAIEAVSIGEAVGYITYSKILEYYKRSGQQVTTFSRTPSRAPSFPLNVSAMLRKDSQGLSDLIDITLTAIVADGTYDSIVSSPPPKMSFVEIKKTIEPTQSNCKAMKDNWDIVKSPTPTKPLSLC
jgi:ABC-type amino acid transport substrate-binding protein